jgi:hypothetical protein
MPNKRFTTKEKNGQTVLDYAQWSFLIGSKLAEGYTGDKYDELKKNTFKIY